MARIRTIKPEFPQSESVGRVSRDARLLFKKAAIPAAVRRAVFSRYGISYGKEAQVKCHYCQFVGTAAWIACSRLGWPTSPNLEFDHIVPESGGGLTSGGNIVLACLPCNRGKGPRTPEQWVRA